MTEPTELILSPGEDIDTPAAVDNFLMDSKAMAQLFKIAKFYASSEIVPASYRGKPADCFVAVELAARMNISPTLVMQNLFIVQGKPAWAGQMCKALIDGCGKYSSSKYVFVGEPNTPEWGCYLEAVERATGRVVAGTLVDIRMATAEGWVKKSGSKWATFPEQMLKYRAAAFFARAECPNVLMGFQTADEVADVRGVEAKPVEVITLRLDERSDDQ